MQVKELNKIIDRKLRLKKQGKALIRERSKKPYLLKRTANRIKALTVTIYSTRANTKPTEPLFITVVQEAKFLDTTRSCGFFPHQKVCSLEIYQKITIHNKRKHLMIILCDM